MSATRHLATKRNELPVGWKLAKLGEICEITMGTSPKGHTYNRNGIGELLLNGPTEFGARHPIAVQWTTNAIRFAEPGDILFCVRGATTGRKNIADQRYCIGRGLAAIRGRAGLADTDFLWYLLDAVTIELVNQAAGSTFVNLPSSELRRFQVPLPPLPEQRRIAGILKDQLAAVGRARAAAAEQLAAARALPGAYLNEAFSREAASHWSRFALGDISDIVSGITLGRTIRDGLVRKVPYLRVANVKDGYLALGDVYEIEATEAEIDKLRLISGDILLTEGGDRDKLGRGTFWREELPECIHQNHIFRVRLDTRSYLPEFISAEIGSAYGKGYFLAHAKQTTGIATINQHVLRGFPVLAPPIEEQRRIATELRFRLAKATAVEKVIQSQLRAVEAMPAALLRSAFQGRL